MLLVLYYNGHSWFWPHFGIPWRCTYASDRLCSLGRHVLAVTILRFIWPYKSECQPIFLKKQGIHSLYAKFWLLRPLIKNIADSSHWYGSNVTFGASLAFQVREEYVFDFFFLKIGPQWGVNSGVTQLYAKFTHISRQFWALNRKQKKLFGKNCLKNVV